ncbi:MAG: nitroreductase family protein [Candidatus Aminicenantales bacterium]
MRKTLWAVLVSIVLVAIGYRGSAAGQNRPGLTLREVFDLYVQSIQDSDLDGLFSTVTKNEKFLFLTSDGKLIDSRNGYSKFHEEWFKGKDWEMPVDNIEVHEGNDTGYTTAVFHYRSRMPDGGRYVLDSWFTLIFCKEEGLWKVVADICTPIARSYTGADSSVKYTADQRFLFETIENRRTVRRFKPDPVPKDHLLKILDAARFAATAGNQQPWKFLVIQDRRKLDALEETACSWILEEREEIAKLPEDKRDEIRRKLREVLKNILSAPVYVAVLVDSRSEYPEYSITDGTLAMGNLMIAARALGYGTGFFTSYFPWARMKEFFHIPERYELICFTPIGVPEEWPLGPAKKSLADLVIFENFGPIE